MSVVHAILFASVLTLAFHLLRLAYRNWDWLWANEEPPTPKRLPAPFVPPKLIEKVDPQLLAELKKKLWKILSVYIRSKDADWRGYTACFTCGKVDDWRSFDAGHFIPKATSGDALYFEEKNLAPQCITCNRLKGGNLKEYRIRLIKKYGEKVIQELDELRRAPPFTKADYEEKIRYYTTLVKILNTRK